jgi:FkbM family methyltransferase
MYYSQTGEDKFLNDHIFKNKQNGIYIELGALDGVLYSNTKFFEDQLMWKGILIEPHPLNFQKLLLNRPNNFLVNALISNSTTPLDFRYFEDYHAAVSGVTDTLSQHHMDKYFENDLYKDVLKQHTIQMYPVTLTEIIKRSNVPFVDLLSLDVEGHEYEVLMSWDFSVPIYVILIETLGVQPEKDEMCRKILKEHNYLLFTTFKDNEIYVLNLQ